MTVDGHREATCATTRVQTLAEISLAIALAAVLNYLGLHLMPQGGAFSLVMLPI